jgi:hypothetical protein
MLKEITSMFNQFDEIQKCIFIFWSICVMMFIVSYVNLIVHFIKLKFKIK